MGQGGSKKALFINYLPQCDKEQRGFETLVKADNFFIFLLSAPQKLNFLPLTDKSKERQGGDKEKERE